MQASPPSSRAAPSKTTHLSIDAATGDFNELVAAYGEDDLPRIKELALLRVQIERTHADALNPDITR